MSVRRPSLWRVLSDTLRIISSNSLHFAALSLLFIFPISLYNIIPTLILTPSPSPSPSPSPFNSNSTIYPLDKSLIRHQLLYGFILLIFNICSASSVTHSVFHAFHRNPIKFSSSLKSILSSFFPLLATKLAYYIVLVSIFLGFGNCMGFVFIGMTLVGLEIETTSKSFMTVGYVTMNLFYVLSVYLWVELCLMDAIVVVESKYGFAPLKRSFTLVKGMRHVAFPLIILLEILQWIISRWFSVLAGGVVLQLVVCAALSTLLTLFGLAANTVLFIHCKALNEESDNFPSDEKKLRQIYVELPHDVVDEA